MSVVLVSEFWLCCMVAPARCYSRLRLSLALTETARRSSSQGRTHSRLLSLPRLSDSGTISGGVVVTFSGVGFRERTTVTFGGIFAADVRVISGTLMYVVAPSHGRGDVDVVVRNPNGRSTMPSARYHYVDDTGSCAGCWDY